MAMLVSYLAGVAVGFVAAHAASGDWPGGYAVDVQGYTKDSAGRITEDYRVSSVIRDKDTLKKYLAIIARHPDDRDVDAMVWARPTLTEPRWHGVIWNCDKGQVELHEPHLEQN